MTTVKRLNERDTGSFPGQPNRARALAPFSLSLSLSLSLLGKVYLFSLPCLRCRDLARLRSHGAGMRYSGSAYDD